MKHILTMQILPNYSAVGPSYINYGGGGRKRDGN